MFTQTMLSKMRLLCFYLGLVYLVAGCASYTEIQKELENCPPNCYVVSLIRPPRPCRSCIPTDLDKIKKLVIYIKAKQLEGIRVNILNENADLNIGELDKARSKQVKADLVKLALKVNTQNVPAGSYDIRIIIPNQSNDEEIISIPQALIVK